MQPRLMLIEVSDDGVRNISTDVIWLNQDERDELKELRTMRDELRSALGLEGCSIWRLAAAVTSLVDKSR